VSVSLCVSTPLIYRFNSGFLVGFERECLFWQILTAKLDTLIVLCGTIACLHIYLRDICGFSAQAKNDRPPIVFQHRNLCKLSEG